MNHNRLEELKIDDPTELPKSVKSDNASDLRYLITINERIAENTTQTQADKCSHHTYMILLVLAMISIGLAIWVVFMKVSDNATSAFNEIEDLGTSMDEVMRILAEIKRSLDNINESLSNLSLMG